MSEPQNVAYISIAQQPVLLTFYTVWAMPAQY